MSPIFEDNLQEPLPLTDARDMSLREFAATNGISEAEVWRRIKRGELAGRPVDGDLRIGPPDHEDSLRDGLDAVYPTMRKGSGSGSVSDAPAPAKKAVLPPVPQSDGGLDSGDSTENRKGALSHWPLSSETGAAANTSTELALLIDHLSLSKDENREILRLAQESIRKITELSDTLVAMKDAVIDAKITQIESLKELLALRDREIKTLQKSNEDLEILARTMSRHGGLDPIP